MLSDREAEAKNLRLVRREQERIRQSLWFCFDCCCWHDPTDNCIECHRTAAIAASNHQGTRP